MNEQELRELCKLAWRAICDADSVIRAIDPESAEEGEKLRDLRDRLSDCAMHLFTALRKPTTGEHITLRQRVDELIQQHGTLRATARVLMTDCGYLHRLRAGEKTEPGDPLLRRMGLREVRLYERTSALPGTSNDKHKEN